MDQILNYTRIGLQIDIHVVTYFQHSLKQWTFMIKTTIRSCIAYF